MGLLDDAMASDRIGFFSTDEFGESVTFRPATGSTRTITVVVNRDIMPDANEEELGIKEVMLVSVANDSTYGIALTDLAGGKPSIDLAYRIGETAKTYILGHPVSIDSAQLIFRVK